MNLKMILLICRLPFWILTFALLGSQACNKMQFSAEEGASILTCNGALRDTQKDLGIVFMVDNSQSTDKTDPNHVYRVQTINKFLNDYQSKTNFEYAFGMFASRASFYDNSTSSFRLPASKAFGGAADLAEALDKYDNGDPNGNTSYGAAFSAIRGTIYSNISTGSKNYSIVFMSDGKPTDVTNVNGLEKLVQDLLNGIQSQGGEATVSTVYFGPPSNNEAINRLQSMAAAGKGQFVNTNTLPNGLIIEDVIVVPGVACVQ